MPYIKGKRDGRIEAGLCSGLQAMDTPVIELSRCSTWSSQVVRRSKPSYRMRVSGMPNLVFGVCGKAPVVPKRSNNYCQ